MKRRRRLARRKRRTIPPWTRLGEVFIAKEIRIKLIATGALASAFLPLLALFAYQGNTDAQYALVLASGALAIILWALPNVKLSLIAAFLFTQPLLIYLGNTEYGYTKAIYSLIFISSLLVIWTGQMALRGRISLQLTPLFWPLSFVVLAASLSLINSETLLGDLQYLVLLVYFALFYLILANLLERQGELRFLVGVLLASAALASIYGLLQYYGVLPGAPGFSKGPGAIISTFGNKNYLGGFLAYLFVPGLALLLLGGAGKWLKAFALVALGLISMALVAIDSDSAWLALILSVLVFLVGLWAFRSWEPLYAGRRWSLALLGTVGVVAFALLVTTVIWVWGRSLGLSSLIKAGRVFSPLAWLGLSSVGLLALAGWLRGLVRLRRELKWAGAGALAVVILALALSPIGRSGAEGLSRFIREGVDKARVQDWWIGYHMLKSQPIVGIGLGDYKREFLPFKAEFLKTPRGEYYNEKTGYILRAAQAHNEYVQIGAELGALGLVATAILIAMLLKSTYSRLRESQKIEARWSLLGLFSGAVAFMSDSLFSFPLHLPANALALAFLVGALHSRALGRPQSVVALGVQATRVFAGVVLSMAIVVSVFAYRDWLADLYLDRGKALLTVWGDELGAQEYFERSIRLDFAPAEALYWLGFLHLRRGDLERSLEFFERSLSGLTTESSYYHLSQVNLKLAQAEKDRGSIEEARLHLKEARRYVDLLWALDPNPSFKPEVRYLHALILYEEGHWEEALATLKEILATHKDPVKIHLNIGEIYLDLGELEGAREHLKQALRSIEEKLTEIRSSLTPGSGLSPAAHRALISTMEELERLKARVEELLSRLPR